MNKMLVGHVFPSISKPAFRQVMEMTVFAAEFLTLFNANIEFKQPER